MVEFLFLDLDETILDFYTAERIALEKTFRELGVDSTPEMLARYKQINIAHWKKLELGEITRKQVKDGRFEQLFQEMGITCDATLATPIYERHLAEGHYFLSGAEEAVKRLSKKYRLFLASNGTASVQKGRMTSADLYRFFEQTFVSEEIGYNKPAKAYFDTAFSRIPDFDPENALMVGDSLTSDIRGGNNAGIRTCWINPGHVPRDPEIHVDYEIESLSQLEELLETLK